MLNYIENKIKILVVEDNKSILEGLRYLLEKTQLGGDELTFEEFCTMMKNIMKS